MTLSQYLERYQETQAAFARRCGIAQPVINAYVRGRRFPGVGSIRRIEEATEGAVRFEDWARAREAAA